LIGVDLLATILQVSGLAAVSIGITMFSIPAGIIFAGISFILLGLALERGR
jgi:hypothetical protein